MRYKIVVGVVLAISLINIAHAQDPLLVRTSNGFVQGTAVTVVQDSLLTTRISAFLGIPFAQPPVNSMRFARPVPVQNWNGILNATQNPNQCYQMSGMGPSQKMSEDCLYLNIYSPYPRPTKAAVMVWIHGGGFGSGSASDDLYNGGVLVAESGVITVNIQYRLGVFGFLYLGTSDAPGNVGLLDQTLALKWIYENIGAFGGDNSKITLFGESAGAQCVSLHLVSPLSTGYFTSAILQSGSMFATWQGRAESAVAGARVLAAIGCAGANVTCARSVEPATVLQRANAAVAPLQFRPVVDGYFVQAEQRSLLAAGRFKRCPLLLGSNKNEGTFLLATSNTQFINESFYKNIGYAEFVRSMTTTFTYFPSRPTLASNRTFDAILYRYSNWNNVENRRANFDNYEQAYGDFLMVCPTVGLADAYALNGIDVYYYQLTERSSQSRWPEWFGSTHTDDLPFVFGVPLRGNSNYTQREKALSRAVIRYWTNFAKVGVPNGDGLARWPTYRYVASATSDLQREFLVLNGERMEVGYNIRAEYCRFWNAYLLGLVAS